MEHVSSDPWKISERDFPAKGPMEAQLRFLLNYAILAPSKHNTQPWLFHVERNTIELYADQTRVLSMVDAAGRELIMSCGAALANLHVMWDEQQRATLAQLILNADQSLWADPGFRHELAQWVHTNESNSPDGIPAYALGKADTTSYLGMPPLHTLIETSEEKHEAQPRTVKPPVLAVLSTVNDDWFDWLEAGLALENILLHARLAGIWASFFSQPTEVAAQRQALRDLLGKADFPQIVLRLGYASRVPPTPRREVDDILT